MAVHGTIPVDCATLAEGLGFIRSARRAVLDDPPLAEQRLGEIEQLLEVGQQVVRLTRNRVRLGRKPWTVGDIPVFVVPSSSRPTATPSRWRHTQSASTGTATSRNSWLHGATGRSGQNGAVQGADAARRASRLGSPQIPGALRRLARSTASPTATSSSVVPEARSWRSM